MCYLLQETAKENYAKNGLKLKDVFGG